MMGRSGNYNMSSLVTDLTGEVVKVGDKFPFIDLHVGDIISLTNSCSDNLYYFNELESDSTALATRLLKRFRKGKRSAEVIYVSKYYVTIRITDVPANKSVGYSTNGGWNVSLNPNEFDGVFLLRRSA